MESIPGKTPSSSPTTYHMEKEKKKRLTYHVFSPQMGKEITELFRGTGNLLLTYTPLQESLESY